MEMSTFRAPTLTLPILARGVLRDDVVEPAGESDGTGVAAAGVDCRKLRGPAREICYKAVANRPDRGVPARQ